MLIESLIKRETETADPTVSDYIKSLSYNVLFLVSLIRELKIFLKSTTIRLKFGVLSRSVFHIIVFLRGIRGHNMGWPGVSILFIKAAFTGILPMNRDGRFALSWLQAMEQSGEKHGSLFLYQARYDWISYWSVSGLFFSSPKALFDRRYVKDARFSIITGVSVAAEYLILLYENCWTNS